MLLPIPGRAPVDRYFMLPPPDSGQRPTQFITFGAHSYGSINFETGGEAPINVFVGRFSSIAGGFTVSMGLNHLYKNVVTTYPFDDGGIGNEFTSYGKNYLRDEIPRSRRLDNHYQTIIGNDVWIGRCATVMGGVKIGSGAIIGANSVVAKDIPPYAIAVGNPAQVVKYRFNEEQIKKFMAIKWWNWDIDKVCANVHKMYDVEKFLAEHYTSELENVVEDDLGKEVEKYREEGRKVYTFIADFRSPYPVWRRVLRGLYSSNIQNAVMIFFLGLGATDKDIEELKNFPNTLEKITASPVVKCISTVNGKIYSSHVLKKSDYFITNREMITSECLDLLYNADVKILSALNDGIFEGEPLVDWSKV